MVYFNKSLVILDDVLSALVPVGHTMIWPYDIAIKSPKKSLPKLFRSDNHVHGRGIDRMNLFDQTFNDHKVIQFRSSWILR